MGKSIPLITIVIPLREIDNAEITLKSLANQTCQDFTVIEVKDQGKGAPWARNEGFKQVKSEFVLFSDGDIDWKPHALQSLLYALRVSKASYSYGRYKLNNDLWSHQPWNTQMLKQKNYISSMSLIRTKDLPTIPWDENIMRLQDWDLWLTLLDQGKRGVYCEDLIFETQVKPGISFGNPVSYVDAVLIIKKKHHIE